MCVPLLAISASRRLSQRALSFFSSTSPSAVLHTTDPALLTAPPPLQLPAARALLLVPAVERLAWCGGCEECGDEGDHGGGGEGWGGLELPPFPLAVVSAVTRPITDTLGRVAETVGSGGERGGEAGTSVAREENTEREMEVEGGMMSEEEREEGGEADDGQEGGGEE